jgi:uncharacterized protein YndB with AHSA1/START domain
MTDLMQRELSLPGTPAQLWPALTDPAWLQSWLADEVALELRPGGEARFRFGDELRDGWVEEVSPPAPGSGPGTTGRLCFWWQAADEPASRVSLELIAADGGSGSDWTTLRVIEARPLEVLDLVGLPMPGNAAGGARYGPALIAAAG